MEDVVKSSDLKIHQQGTRFEGKDPDQKIHLPKSQKKVKVQFDRDIYEKYLSMDVLKIGEVDYKVKFSKDLPVLSYEKFSKLFYKIVARGIKYPVVVDEHNYIIDGRFCLIAALILKLKQIPFIIESGLTDAEKYDLAYDLNVLRRQLTEEQQSELVIRYRKDGKSYREIGQELGISHNSVRNKVLEAGVQNLTPDELPAKTTGRDGRQYPSVIQRKNNPSVFAKSVSEAKGAAEACAAIGAENLPDKIIDIKRLGKIASTVKNEELRKESYTDVKNGSYELLLGDFREKAQEIPDESINMIFTDPPYDEKSLPLWDDLGKLAKKVLKPGGFLLAYSGQMYLPQIIQMLGNNLQYVWPLAVLHSGHTMIVHTVNVQQQWKPVLWYCKPPFNKNWSAFKDICSGGEDKQFHEWGQAVGEARYYLKALCPKDAVVLDPMMGGATTVIAAKQLGFKAIGIEADPARFAVAQQRLAEIG